MHRLRALDRSWLKAVLLCVLVWSVYANSLQSPFEFDDWHVVPDNPAIKSLDRIPSYFTDVSSFSILVGNRDYRPAFLTSMAICWWLGDGSTVPFHVLSVLLHMGTSVLLFYASRELLRSNATVPPRVAEWSSFFAAALFAVHPLASETVNYISSQSEAMAALFYVLSFHLLIRLLPGATTPRRRLIAVFSSCVAFAFALLAKPIAITLPAVVFLWRWTFGADAHGGSARKRLLGATVAATPHMVIAILYMLLRRAVGVSGAGNLVADRPELAHVLSWYLTQTKAIVFYYLRLSFVPTGLNLDREYPLSTSFFEPPVFASFVVIAAAAVAIYRLRRFRAFFFWSLWFPVCLFVTTYATTLGQVVNEHRVYLSLAGFCCAAGALACALWSGSPLRFLDTIIGPRTSQRVGGALAVLLICTFAQLTRARNFVWASSLSLWENAARSNGTWRAHMNYGLALEGAGRPDEALQELERAVELAPYAWAHMNLGLAHVRRATVDVGLEHLRTAVRLWPALPEAHLYLGWGLERAGHAEEAAQEMRRSIELRPNYVRAFEYLGALHARQGRPDEAIAAYRRALALSPEREWVEKEVRRLEGSAIGVDPDLRAGLDAVSAGDFAGAMQFLTRVHAGDSTNAVALFGLAFAHQKLGEGEDAVRLYEALIRLDPSHRQGTFNLAYVYRDGTTRERQSRSAVLFERVLQIDPNYDEALHHMATVFWRLGDERSARRTDSLYVRTGTDADLKRISRGRLAADE